METSARRRLPWNIGGAIGAAVLPLAAYAWLRVYPQPGIDMVAARFALFTASMVLQYAAGVSLYLWVMNSITAATTQSPRPSPPSPRPFRIAVEGNIGVGKSTILKAVAAELSRALDGRVETLAEPVDLWTNVRGHNPLAAFYRDKTRYAFSFQSFALASRLINCMRVAREWCSGAVANPNGRAPPAVILLERSPLSDRVFAENCRDSGIMEPMEAAIYDEWWTCLVGLIEHSKPDAIIYLRTDPETCYARIQERNRPEECGGVGSGSEGSDSSDSDSEGSDSSDSSDDGAAGLKQYLRDLHARHETWLSGDVDAHHGLPVLHVDAAQNFRDDPAVCAAIAQDIAAFSRARIADAA